MRTHPRHSLDSYCSSVIWHVMLSRPTGKRSCSIATRSTRSKQCAESTSSPACSLQCLSFNKEPFSTRWYSCRSSPSSPSIASSCHSARQLDSSSFITPSMYLVCGNVNGDWDLDENVHVFFRTGYLCHNNDSQTSHCHFAILHHLRSCHYSFRSHRSAHCFPR